jgi:hypothetical protein
MNLIWHKKLETDPFMNTLSQLSETPRRCRAHLWAAVIAAIHISIIVSPIRIFDLLPNDLGFIPYTILSVPMIMSFAMLASYRTRRERIIAWCAFVFSAVRMMSVGGIRG